MPVANQNYIKKEEHINFGEWMVPFTY